MGLCSYTVSMSFFVHAVDAPPSRTETSKQIAVFLAGSMTVMSVAQLYSLEEFIEVAQTFALPFGQVFAAAFVPIIISLEVFSLPFLLRMRLSSAMRWCSMVFGWGAAVAWLFVSAWLASVQPEGVETVGFLGSLAAVQPGWWAVYVSGALCILVAWASWGLWPGYRGSRSSKK